jgi:hypothetical protein
MFISRYLRSVSPRQTARRSGAIGNSIDRSTAIDTLTVGDRLPRLASNGVRMMIIRPPALSELGLISCSRRSKRLSPDLRRIANEGQDSRGTASTALQVDSVHRSFWIRQLPFSLMLLLTIGGVAYNAEIVEVRQRTLQQHPNYTW